MIQFKALLFLSLFRSAISFNIQEMSKGTIRVSPKRGNQFGFSVILHENQEGKWLLVGAPKDRAGRIRPSNNSPSDGAFYTCNLNKIKKIVCTKFNISLKQSKELVYACDFEDCDLEQLASDNFDWTRDNVPTPSENTGPTYDHTKNSTSAEPGYYIYMEASRPSRVSVYLYGLSAMAATPVLHGTVGDCLRFWYHMYGNDVVSLKVYLSTNETGLLMIWSKHGNQGNMWHEGYVTIISEYSFKVVFEGIRGKEWRGDIALDDITVIKGQCPEDIDMNGQSVGSTLVRNPQTGELLTCAPTWRYNCSGQIHSSGVCYLLDKNLSTTTMSILTPCRNQVCSTGKVDIVFLIDGSNSVSSGDFENIKLWLRNLVSSLPISPELIQVGVLVYTATPVVKFELNTYERIEDIRSAVGSMNFTGGYTHTGQALDKASDDMFTIEHGMRPDAQHLAIIMTDGKSQDDVVGPSRRAKEKGVTIFVIGVGSPYLPELQVMSSDPDKYIFEANDYSALDEIRSALQQSIAALESQGKTSTTEQGQAGFSAWFYNNATIIGAPGLDDWSGGYSSYYMNHDNLEPPFRVLTTFQNLLKSQAEDVATDMNLTSLATTAITLADVGFVNATKVSINDITVDDTNTSSITTNTQIVVKQSPTHDEVNFATKSNVSVFPTAVSNRTKRGTTLSDYDFFDGPTDLFKPSPTKQSYNTKHVSPLLRENQTTSFSVNPTRDAATQHEVEGSSEISTTSVDINRPNQTTFMDVMESSGENSTGDQEQKDLLDMLHATDQAFTESKPLNTYHADIGDIKATSAISHLRGSTGAADILESYFKSDFSKPTKETYQKNTISDVIFATELLDIQHTPTKISLHGTDMTKLDLNQRIKRSIPGQVIQEQEPLDWASYAYFGYSITSGVFMERGQTELAFGAPRALSHGAVFIIRQANEKEFQIKPEIKARFRSEQMGSYFGSSLCAADTNGDGIDELIVGAPLWMGKQEDEGRVFVYISGENQPSDFMARRQVILTGNKEINARFGSSIVTPGDLNMDGFDDVIIGAPSNANGDGAIFVYNGQQDGITMRPTQVIRASQKNKPPVYFGFSIDASLDIDGNGYNDVAIGAPGNDRVVILLTRPVIHVDVKLNAFPSLLNLTNYNYTSVNSSYKCNGNGTKICARVTACFKTYGLHIPNIIIMSYQLHSDTQIDGNPRGRFIQSSGEVKLTNNVTTCENFILYLKLPVRKQLIPLTIMLEYGLFNKTSLSSKSAVLDIFDTKPKTTNIMFAKACHNSTCHSDLQASCKSMNRIVAVQSNTPAIALSYNPRITINLNLTNMVDAAYDVALELMFGAEVYLIQMVPFFSEGRRCVQRVIESNGIKEDESAINSADELLQSGSQRLKLIYSDAIMLQGEKCPLILQFGIQETFQGGYLNFSFGSISNSKEVSPADNVCNLDMMVYYETDAFLKGKSNSEQVEFSESETETITTFDDIGPSISHVYTVTNLGPARIPNATIEVKWPTDTPSEHDIMYLVNVTCEPVEGCICHDINLLINPEHINKSGQMEVATSRGVGEIDLAHIGDPDVKVDKNTSQPFTEATFDCSRRSTRRGVVCESMLCNIEQLMPSSSVKIKLDFRLWKHTFVQGKAWKVSVASQALYSTQLSPFIISSALNPIRKAYTVETEAFNRDFSPTEDTVPQLTSRWWIYLAAILAGLMLLLLTILLLKRLGFFKSKYQQHMQDEMQWTNSYQYTVAKQSETYEGSRDIPEGQTLSTFQGHLPQSPTL